tara:strand:- start:343 stop:591 length:249 start_codon:yes stop_codon:yes gene_type:complete
MMRGGGFIEETGEFVALPADGSVKLQSQDSSKEPWSTSTLIGLGLGAVALAFGIGAAVAMVKKKKSKKGLNGSGCKIVKTKI